MTKPGNSDHPENENTQAVPAESEARAEPAAPEPEAAAEPEPADAKPTEPKAADAKPAGPAAAADAKPAAAKPAKTKATAKPAGDLPAPPKRERAVMPTAREAISGTTGKPIPTVVRWSFYLVLASALVGVLGAVWWLLDKNSLIEEAVNAEREQPLTREQIVNGVTNLLWVLLIANVIFGAFSALFGWKAREGHRRARMQLLIATVIIVMFHYLLVPTTSGLLAALVLAIGTAMLYLPGARDYYPPRQRVK